MTKEKKKVAKLPYAVFFDLAVPMSFHRLNMRKKTASFEHLLATVLEHSFEPDSP